MIIGHTKVLQYLEQAFENGKLAHGYLFYGPEHLGKLKVAKKLAKTLICDNEKAFGGCGQCEMCRAFDQGASSGVMVLRPGEPILASEEKDKNEIGIREVREVRRRLSLIGPRWSVVIIDDADTLTRDAASAFLKVLEEPRAKTLFIFVTSRREFILPTIASRLVPLRFSSLQRDTLEAINGATKELVEIADGAPGIVIRAIEDVKFSETQVRLYDEAKKLYRGSLKAAIMRSEKFYNSSEDREVLIRHLLRMAENNLLGEGQKTKKRIHSLKNALEILRLSETTNVNRRLSTDLLFMELKHQEEYRQIF